MNEPCWGLNFLPTPHKKGIQGMKLNSIWEWVISLEDVGSVKYSHIAIIRWRTLT